MPRDEWPHLLPLEDWKKFVRLYQCWRKIWQKPPLPNGKPIDNPWPSPPGSGLPENSSEVPRDSVDLREDPALISPPIVAGPLYRCATSVRVLGFVAHAELDLEINGSMVDTRVAGFPEPDGFTFILATPLTVGDVVRARQRTAMAQSAWSSAVTVRDHTQDYPAGLPRPQIDPAPVHECGSRTGVSNLLQGCNVRITADGTPMGSVAGANPHQGINVTPDYGLGQAVVALAELCGDRSAPSVTHTTQPPPSPLPMPLIADVYEDGEQIRVTGLANGARFTVSRNGVNQGTWRTWGQAHLVNLSPPFTTGESISIVQRLCPDQPESDPGTTTVLPCAALPAPEIAAIQGGDTVVHVLSQVAGAQIKIYRNGVKIGHGGGAFIVLTQPVQDGDLIHVLQVLGACVGSTVTQVETPCVAPRADGDPSALDIYPVGLTHYDGGSVEITNGTRTVRGTVYYPAEMDGTDVPFHARLAALGPVPIVFIAHGNHEVRRDPEDHRTETCYPFAGSEEIPNHEGYDYLQMALARMGIISVGVYCNETNCVGYSATNIVERAELILANIQHVDALNATPGSILSGKINLDAIGLLGHSRGGEAVVVLPETIPQQYRIRAVLSLAPTNSGASSGRPQGYAFMTILPAGDGDVVTNPGAMFYDQAEPAPFKSQLYVHHANHNYFNRHWPADDGEGAFILARHQHERILKTYGCAFFRRFLLNHTAEEDYLTWRRLPTATATEHVHLSWQHSRSVMVDDHEDGNAIGVNSLNSPTAQTGGITANEYAFRQAGPSYNATFYGDTTGMVIAVKRPGTFRSELPSNRRNLVKADHILIRVAEVNQSAGPAATGITFDLGLEDTSGFVSWVTAAAVGGVPRPYERPSHRKTILKTLRFPLACFMHGELKLDSIAAILLRPQADSGRAIAFDVLQIVS